MMEIDGSYGEGGGQLVRTAVALSAITGRPVKITNIRKNRPNPGLKPQHLKALETAAMVCSARVSGLSQGSTEFSFSPMEIKGGKYRIDIGTAGSIPLLLQCLMPALPFAEEKIELTVKGGTDVAWSPTIDYLRHVTLQALEKMGYAGRVKLQERGYYPKGGGTVLATFEPCKLRGFHFKHPKNKLNLEVRGISHASNLPSHVVARQAEAAKTLLLEEGYSPDIGTECFELFSTGSGITLWTGFFGGSALGKKGLPAEKVGRQAAGEILPELRSLEAVDVHLADQLIPYMALAGNSSYTVRELSMHTKTNIWVTEQFLDVKFRIREKGELFEVSVD
ncbi:RNA 3'-terminal phosphate cyclase [Methanosarcina sp. MTP4]|uniref:RNA 3'-terminal phosphate cyclase n=1 Tax=Methanosarcina sp. MTP4 TaxID=1434100 RepID=UPI000615D0A3|nr:RNA 3'-terminal phosphate cyclase [Methanosarcina sp. MTP4]AKB23488.1 RNA 3'-terminal phosphate cyclase [Methanosarcina sp. MTP4]